MKMKLFSKYKRIVIKIGSSILVNKSNHKIKNNQLNSLCKEIKVLHEKNKEIVIVSSGAIALGKKMISSIKPIIKLEDKQAAAAVGQIKLINNWKNQGCNNISFIIGGADGVDENVFSKADHILSFGKLTWPHILIRVMLVEQIYRAETIEIGHPYHRN